MNTTISMLRGFLLMGFLVLLAGCKQPVEIVSPIKDAVSNTAPEFRIRFNKGVPSSFTATINGAAINQSSFTVSGNDVFTPVTLSQLHAGDNEFAVTSPEEVTRIFHLDQIGPVIHILSGDGTNPRLVTGYLSDRGGPTSLSINGTSFALDAEGKFSGETADASLFNFVATDVYGYATSESYAKLGQSFNPAIAVRINQQGLEDSLPNAILQIVESLDFNAFITNPISESCSDALIADACANFNINDVTLTPGSTVEIQALSGNRLRANIGLSRLDLDTTATTYAKCKSFLCGGSGSIFGTLNFSGVTTVQNTDIAAEFVVTVSNGNVTVQIDEGTLDVDMPADGLQVDIDFGAVESVPFVGSLLNTVVNGIINGLVGILSSIIVDIADGFLSSPISSLINSLIANLLPDSISVPVANTVLNLGFSPEGFATSAGGFDLVLANSISIATTDPTVLPPLGSLYAAGNAPSPYPSATRDGTNVDLTATVSSNLINQVLTEAYKGGLLNITLDEEHGLTIGTLLGIPDFPIDLEGLTDWNLTVTGATPPTVAVISQANAADGLIGVNLLDLTIKLNLDFGDGMQEVLSTSVDVQSPFDIGITPENTLTIGIEATPIVNVHSFRFQLNGLVLDSGSSDAISDLISTIAPQFLPKALEAIGGIPVPAIAGFSLQLRDIWNPNASNNAFLSLGGNLVSAAAAATAEAPVVSALVEEKAFSFFGTVSIDEQRRATIDVSGENPGSDPLEYRYRVNGGYWTVWKPRDSIQLSHLPAGDNVVDVCARTDLLQEDCTQVVVNVPSAQ